MNRRTLAIATLIALVVIVVGAVIYLKTNPSRGLPGASAAPSKGGVSVGEAAPQFTLPSTAGTFDVDALNRPALIEIFATWCPHCQRETVVLNKLYASYGSHVAFLAVPGSDTGMDGSSPETQLDVLNFRAQFKVKYPIAAYDPTLAVAKRYLKGGYPTLVIVGRDKKVAYVTSGETPYPDLASALNQALK